MIKNYLKLAFRNLYKSKAHTLINISGLAVGMASVILILLWIQNEVSHDRFYKKIDRIYIANNKDTVNGKLEAWNNTPKIMGPTIKSELPEVEDVVRINDYGANFLLTVGDKHLNLHGDFVDSTFFNIFDLPLMTGNAQKCLEKPNYIVLTQQLAKKLFGNEDAMGKTVRIDSSDNFIVTGVLKDLPPNTSFAFEYLLPWRYASLKNIDDSYWGNNSVYTYILLKPGATQATLDKKLYNISYNHTKSGSDPVTSKVFSHPLKDAWLYSKSENGKYVAGRMQQVRMFAIIAGFILLIACINFMNLSTARSEKRAKEVGIRKVAGAGRRLLVLQFIGESTMLALMAGVLAIIIVQLCLQPYSELVGKQLNIDYSNGMYWLIALAFILFTGLLAGSYPAFYLSSFQPIKVLKGTFKAANAAVTPRKVLVVIQFTCAIALIISTIIVQQQIKYAQERDNGYNREHLAFIIMFGDAFKNYHLIKDDLLRSGAVTAVTATSAPLTEHWSDSWGFEWQGSDANDKKLDFTIFGAEKDFISTMGLKVLQGRDIDLINRKTDSSAVLLNETAVKKMRLKHPVGTIINAFGQKLEVIGVLKDFIVETPYEPVRPLIIGGNFGYDVINFKLNPGMPVDKSIAKAEAVFKKYNPQYPFTYKFYDSEYARKFEDEQRTGKFAGIFAGLTIFISCLGLFGLATYMAENRTKEIGVRKVLGASVSSIITLLSKDFLKLILIAFIIASSIAWLGMHQWLLNYSYRVPIAWWVFAGAGLLTVLVTLLTVSYQSIRAAMMNPVRAIKTE